MDKRKTIVFCAHLYEVKYLLSKIKNNTKKYDSIGRTWIEIDNHIYEFVSIMSKGLDGLTSHEFLLSPVLLKKGSKEQIDLAINLGVSFTAPYR